MISVSLEDREVFNQLLPQGSFQREKVEKYLNEYTDLIIGDISAVDEPNTLVKLSGMLTAIKTIRSVLLAE